MTDSKYKIDTGKRIQFLRAKLGITQADLAFQIGVSKQTIHRYETDPFSKIPYDKIEKLSVALQTTPGYLLCWESAAFVDNIEDDFYSDALEDSEIQTIDPVSEMMALLPEERDEIIDTGAFNSIIEGYLILTLKKMGYSDKDIFAAANILQNEILEYDTAKNARKAAETIQKSISKGNESQAKSNLYKFPFKQKEP